MQQYSFGKLLIVVFILVVVAAGAVSGYFLAKGKVANIGGVTPKEQKVEPGKPPPPQLDTQTFRDRAVGVIEKNDLGDKYAQGTHKLAREGGPSQTAYLVSSVVDLNLYLGKKVEVWGETFSSAQVGWLMDVGKVNAVD